VAPPSKYSPEFREEAVQIALRSSKTISETARELDLNPETLRGWVKKHQKQHEPPADAELSMSERARLKELERRIREVEMENAFLKKMRSVLREGSPVASKYEFIDEMRLDTVEYAYSVEFMCDRLDVSKSGYYNWRGRPESATAQRREELKLLIKKAFEDSDSTYGYRRIHAQLRRWGHTAGLELVRRLMRELGLEPCQPKPKRFKPHPTHSRHRTGPRGPQLHRRRTRRKARRRHHLHSHRGRMAVFGDRHRLLHEGSHRVRDGRPLPDPADIPSHPQRRTEQGTRTGRHIPLRPWK